MKKNCILVFNENVQENCFEKDVGFNLKPYQIIKINDTNDMTEQLIEQIEIFYGLSLPKAN
jgi:hypothetical protein